MIPILKVRDNDGNVQAISVVAAPSVLAPHADSHSKDGTDPITPAGIGAAEAEHTHTAEDVGAAEQEHTHTVDDVEELEERITEAASNAADKAIDALGIEEAIAGAAKIATGSYVGTGTFGSANPTSLTFDFVPKILWVESGGFLMDAVIQSGKTYIAYGNGHYAGHISVSGTTVSWYTTANSAAVDMNTLDTTYHYVAIG